MYFTSLGIVRYIYARYKNNEIVLFVCYFSVHDDEYMSKQNYYGQAHEIRESVCEQASIMINGKLKEYQVGCQGFP